MENLLSLQKDFYEQQETIRTQVKEIERLMEIVKSNSDTNVELLTELTLNGGGAGGKVVKTSKPKPTYNKEGDNKIQQLELANRVEQSKKVLPNTCLPVANKTICLPNFICIGTMKSGTTFLDYYLQKHPQVAKHTKKEIWFFNSFYSYGVEWYANHFEPVLNFDNQKLIGESTPFYINNPNTAARMFVTLKNVKMILMLRDPVDRALSQYYFSIKWLERNKSQPLNYTFEEMITQEIEVIDTCVRGNQKYHEQFQQRKLDELNGDVDEEEEWDVINPFYQPHTDKNWTFYKECSRCEKCWPTGNILHTSGHPTFGMVAKSLYWEQLDHWLNFFPLDQFLIVRYEDLHVKPEKVLREVEEFLGLPAHNYGDFIPKNAVPHEKMDPKMEKLLTDYFRPHNEKLYKLLNRDMGWRR
ncbi:sulfotransferase [Tieghemostelium lacteum]|uniref:Sulfotransferase n=1 Tax=Tieghemostelium lacteum TaxID=361077 RepID=A0A151ZFC7_TIELA|nr:sulfotransferase [Tieghemostelium lacteum]|eukprot:KYQ92682.1 sulfotransferase [Tieghemostelium lacteum]